MSNPRQESRWSRWARIILYAVLFVPLVLYEPLFFPLVSPKAFFLIIVSWLLMLFVVWGIGLRRLSLPSVGVIAFAISAYVLVQFLAAVFGVDSTLSFWSQPDRMTGVVLLLFLLAIFWASIVLLREHEQWEWLMLISITVALLVAAVHLLTLGGVTTLLTSNNGSTLGNSTLLGGYLLFQIGFGAYFVATLGRARWLRVYSALATGVLVLTLFSTDARAAQWALIGGAVLAGCLYFITSGKRLVKRVGVLGVGLLVAVFLIVTIGIFVDGSRLQEVFITATSESRLVVWNMAWRAFLERPLLGWGPETFSHVFVAFYDPCFGSDACGVGYWFDRAHNIVFETLVGSGLLGALAYVFALSAPVFVLWRRYASGDIPRTSPIFVTTLLAMYVAQNLTGFDSIPSLLFWFLVLGFAQSSVEGRLPVGHPRVLKRRQVAIPIITTVLAMCVFPALVLVPWQGFRAVYASIDAPNMQEHLAQYETAVTVSNVGLNYRRSFMTHKTNALLWYTPRSSVEQVATSVSQELALAREALQDTISRSPWSLGAYLQLGRLYQIEGRFFRSEAFEQGELVLRRAMAVSPNNPHPAWALASVLLEQGRVEEAVELTQAVLDRDPRVLKAHTARAVAVKFLGDDERLQQVAQESADEYQELLGQLQYIVTTDLETEYLRFLGHFY
ncbi:O-antigen ligase family protein [Candidatus Uhrbacteria bacterium]|nr:O-antigen ligase family protein [Candidatus Uhrbacteria bacterium]